MHQHTKRHWHQYLSVIALVGAGVVATLSVERAYVHLRAGGFLRGPVPQRILIGVGTNVPPHSSLSKYVTRIHDQGTSNSCVGQSLSTLVEIVHRERHLHQWRKFSAGYIWNQVDQGRNQGISYDDAFHVLLGSGDARLKDFRPDGAFGWGIEPNAYVRHAAYAHRFLSWRSISPADRHTMEFEISHGRPIALAIPVSDSFYTLWNSPRIPIVSSQFGPQHFYHSITGIAYNRTGLVILNSWGPLWGRNGRAILTWSFIRSQAIEVVVATPLPKKYGAQA